jgi:hypothetical protein
MEVVIDYTRFHSYLDTVQHSVLRYAVERLADRRLRIPVNRFQAAITHLNVNAAGILELGQGIKLTRIRQRIYLFKDFPRSTDPGEPKR